MHAPTPGETTPPTISVVIPTYKHAHFILETLESVFAQTLPPLEIIVVNDGSPDNTEQVLLPLIDGNRIKYIAQVNQGQAKARNVGIEASSGSYIALLDDDDLWPPDKLEHQVKTLQHSNDTVLSYGGVCPFKSKADLPPNLSSNGLNNKEKNAPTGHVLHHFLRRNWIISPGQTLIRRSSLASIGGYDPTIWGCDDYDLYIRLAKQGRFAYSDKTALFYRYHDNNASRNIDRMFKNNGVVLKKHFGRIPLVSNPILWIRAQWHYRSYYYERYTKEAMNCHNSGNQRSSKAMLGCAARVFPIGVFRRTFLRKLYIVFIKPIFS